MGLVSIEEEAQFTFLHLIDGSTGIASCHSPSNVRSQGFVSGEARRDSGGTTCLTGNGTFLFIVSIDFHFTYHIAVLHLTVVEFTAYHTRTHRCQ